MIKTVKALFGTATSFVAPFALKIAGGVCIALAAACLLLWLLLAGEQRHSRKVEGQLATANAKIETQNAAVKAWQDEAARQHKVAREAQAEARKAGDSLRAQAGRAEARRPLSGRCETPPAVAEAARGL
jgi:hypothetical protein